MTFREHRVESFAAMVAECAPSRQTRLRDLAGL